MKGWDQQALAKLAVRGMKVNVPQLAKNRVVIPKPDCPQVQWLHWNLLYFANQQASELHKEYKFHSVRLWRFDFYLVCNGRKIGIEYEGLGSDISRHTTFKGYSADTDKYREAAKLGIMVLRYTAGNYKNVLQDLRDIINQKT